MFQSLDWPDYVKRNPTYCAFLVGLTANQNPSDNVDTIIQFDKIIHQYGSQYIPSEYTFVSPGGVLYIGAGIKYDGTASATGFKYLKLSYKDSGVAATTTYAQVCKSAGGTNYGQGLHLFIPAIITNPGDKFFMTALINTTGVNYILADQSFFFGFIAPNTYKI